MLGKDHLKITFVFSVPFIVYLLLCVLSFELPIYIVAVFSICILIGSLTPDADCGGKSELYYKHQGVYQLMRPIHWLILLLTRKLVKQYPNNFNPVKEEHRGMLHSLVGVFLSSFLLSISFSIFALMLLYFSELFPLSDVFYIFVLGFIGLLLGQILHLAEDSCTKRGIKWFLPFSKKLIQGNISTKSENKNEMIDIRPRYFARILRTTGVISSFLILLVWSFMPEYSVYSLFAALFIQCSAFIHLYSISQQKLEGSEWHKSRKEIKKQEKEEAKRRKKEMDNFFK